MAPPGHSPCIFRAGKLTILCTCDNQRYYCSNEYKLGLFMAVYKQHIEILKNFRVKIIVFG